MAIFDSILNLVVAMDYYLQGLKLNQALIYSIRKDQTEYWHQVIKRVGEVAQGVL